MISGNGYREFAAAFNRGVVKPGDDIVVSAIPPFKRGSAERKYRVEDLQTLKEYVGHMPENLRTNPRSVLQGMPWYITEKASEQQI